MPITRLPEEISQDIILTYADNQSLITLLHTSHFFNAITKRHLLTEKLLQYVIDGKQKKAEELLKLNPNLLLYANQVTDYSGRKIEGTAYRLALGARDTRIQPDEECMVEMIERYLKKLPNGNAELLKQYEDQFPHGWEEEAHSKNKRDLAALKILVNAINTAQATTHETLEQELEPALNAFRDYLKPNDVIKTGIHFNGQLLIAAFEIYDQDYAHAGDGWTTPKNLFFWQKVIGYLQRFLPACDAQVFSQGIYYIIEEREKLQRELALRFGGQTYYPLSSHPEDFRLGYEFAVSNTGWPEKGIADSSAARSACTWLEKLSLIKNTNIGKGYALAKQSLASNYNLSCLAVAAPNLDLTSHRII